VRLPRSAGPLTGAELAEAAVLGDLAVALLFLGWMLPLGPIIQVLSVIPQAALAHRHRPRAVVASAVASSSVAFLLGGVNLWSIALIVAFMGLAAGGGIRRGWGLVRIGLLGLVIWAVVAGLAVLQLTLFSSFRQLTFDQIRNTWHGLRRTLGYLSRWFGPVGTWLHWGDLTVNWTISHWYLLIPVALLGFVEVVLLLATLIARPALRSLERSMGRPASRAPAPSDPSAHFGVEPVPAVFEEVAFRYPGAERYALSGVNLELPRAAYVAVVGRNGSGKSTLARVAAGMLEPEGRVSRPGQVGLGRPGGTAVIFQRPESQVLGVRVRDDLVWGMSPGPAADVDVDGLLDRVGLSGMGEAETSTLSGGQLQRLAIASALARRPHLLVSDESTAMLDPAGRRQVAELLACLPAAGEVTVLHVTHRPEESAAAELTVQVDAGQVRSG
jgi:energy-coupling factor transporter ATP-binding protein EcfA2